MIGTLAVHAWAVTFGTARIGLKRAAAPPSPLLAVLNITAQLSTASVPSSYYSMWYHMKAPMEKWTKSTFYSATANEVSNGKMDQVHIFGNFFSEIYFCDLVHFSFVLTVTTLITKSCQQLWPIHSCSFTRVIHTCLSTPVRRHVIQVIRHTVIHTCLSTPVRHRDIQVHE